MKRTRRGFLATAMTLAAARGIKGQESRQARSGGKIKITDPRCAIIGRNPVVRVVTDQGISGYGQAESSKAYLKPMVLKDVAQDVEMHESTISRVTSNKYVHTPQGIFELKYFFDSSINTSRGDNVASESVKEKIRQILAQEDPRKPYSDQELVENLKKQDILIARRTVTKYREMLNLGSSTQRRRLF